MERILESGPGGARPPRWIALLLLVSVPLTVAVGRGIAQSTSQPSPVVVHLEGESGKAVFESFCIACHELPTVGRGVNIPPDLRFEGSRVQYDWLVEYLSNPTRPRMRWQSEGVRSALAMPAFSMTPELTEDMARYLMSRQDSTLIPPSGIDWELAASPGAIAEGRKLFEEYQCQGCHSLGGVGLQIGPSLDAVGSRLRPDFMYSWVLEPERIVPETPMTNKDLWEDEAQSLVLFLRSLKAQE